jgi:DUF1680 family protein
LLPEAGALVLRQDTGYPFDGAIRLALGLERESRFVLRLRIPTWTEAFTVRINGEAIDPRIDAHGFASLERTWHDGDTVDLTLPMTPRLHHATQRNVQESRAPDGSAVAQEVLHFDYVALTRGPLVYATGLIDGYKLEETLLLPDAPLAEWLGEVPGDPPLLELRPLHRSALRY